MSDRISSPKLPEVRLNLNTPRNPGVGVVTKSELCTRPKAASLVRHIELDISATAFAGAFRPGQSFGVLPPGMDEQGRPHKLRLYSIASPASGEDGRGTIVATTVERVIEEIPDSSRLYLGVASNYLCDLRPGDDARVTGPSGKRFLLPERPEDHDYVFIATGTGIAPFRGMIRELVDRRVPSNITLVMGSPYETDLLYDDELLELEGRVPGFSYLTALSRQPQRDGSGGKMYVQDRLRTQPDRVMQTLASDRGLVYMCGLAAMELGVMQALAAILPNEVRSGFVELEAAAPRDPAEWTAPMIGRVVRPTGRVFVEVY